MFLNIKSRWTAFLIHFCISAVIAGIVLWLTFKVWYPGALFEIVDIQYLITLLIVIDVVLGPILTLVVFKRGKKSLKFDLATIACVQIVALVYGVSVLFQIRPAFIVFNEDKVFELVLADEVVEMNPDRESTDYSMDDIPWWGPEVVYSEFPENNALGIFMQFHLNSGTNFSQVIDYYQKSSTLVIDKITSFSAQANKVFPSIPSREMQSLDCLSTEILSKQFSLDNSDYILIFCKENLQENRIIHLITKG